MNKITTFVLSVKDYTKYMKQYVLDTFPADLRRSPAFWRAFALGLVMLVLAVTQLFEFEDFTGILEYMRLPGGSFTNSLLAGLLPFLEIASLPYLLSMRVGSLVRRVSLACGFLAALLWLAVTLWTTLTMGASVESGLFGATIATSSGWWSVVFAVLLLWSVWLTSRELPKRHF